MVYVLRNLIKVRIPKGKIYIVDYSQHYGVFKTAEEAAIKAEGYGNSPRSDYNSLNLIISPELEEYLGKHFDD